MSGCKQKMKAKVSIFLGNIFEYYTGQRIFQANKYSFFWNLRNNVQYVLKVAPNSDKRAHKIYWKPFVCCSEGHQISWEVSFKNHLTSYVNILDTMHWSQIKFQTYRKFGEGLDSNWPKKTSRYKNYLQTYNIFHFVAILKFSLDKCANFVLLSLL